MYGRKRVATRSWSRSITFPKGILKKKRFILNAHGRVDIFIGSMDIRTAFLHDGDGPGKLCHRLHGQELQIKNGQNLVVLKREKIACRFRVMAYPYFCPGPEDSTFSLNDLHLSGFYVWDLNKRILSRQ